MRFTSKLSMDNDQTTTPGTTCPTFYDECVGSLTSPASHYRGDAGDGAYGLQMSLQRQYILLSWSKKHHKRARNVTHVVIYFFSVLRAKKAWKGFAFIIVLRLWRIFRVVISKYSIFFQLILSCYSREACFPAFRHRP